MATSSFIKKAVNTTNSIKMLYCKRIRGDIMTEVNQRVAVTKRMLKEGLIRLLDKKPLDKVNITELCQEAGINRTTFYRHYELPSDVLTEMQSEFFEETFGHFQKPLTADDIERFFVRLSERAELVKLFFRYNSDVEWTKIFTKIYNSFPEKRMMKAFKNLDENSSKLLFSYLTGGAYFLARQWIMEDIPMRPKDVAAIALSILDKDRLF